MGKVRSWSPRAGSGRRSIADAMRIGRDRYRERPHGELPRSEFRGANSAERSRGDASCGMPATPRRHRVHAVCLLELQTMSPRRLRRPGCSSNERSSGSEFSPNQVQLRPGQQASSPPVIRRPSYEMRTTSGVHPTCDVAADGESCRVQGASGHESRWQRFRSGRTLHGARCGLVRGNARIWIDPVPCDILHGN